MNERRKPVLSVTIDDCEVQHFRAGGKGGQHQNKTSSGSRVIHHPSGARGESREERSQPQNTKNVFFANDQKCCVSDMDGQAITSRTIRRRSCCRTNDTLSFAH